MENAFTKRGHVMAKKTSDKQMKSIVQQLQNLIKSLQLILIPAFVKIGCLNALMKSAFHIGGNAMVSMTVDSGVARLGDPVTSHPPWDWTLDISKL